MSQPPPWDQGQPSHDDQPPGGQPPGQVRPSPWPSGNEPPAWPSTGAAGGSTQGQPPSWPTGDQAGPGSVHGHGPRLPRIRRRRPRFLGAIIALGVIIVLGVVAGRLSRSHETVSTSVTPFPSGTGASAGHQEPPGRIGSSFELRDGGGHVYQVTLAKVIDPAKGGNQFTVPGDGKRFVGLIFRIKALTGSPQDEDANDDAVLTGGNGQAYSAGFEGIAGYANFDHGTIQVAPGETVTGSVTFQVPNGVAVSSVKWTALSGFGSRVEWIVHS